MSVLRFEPKPRGRCCGIPYQLSSGPWFGPQKRGRELLRNSLRQVEAIAPDDFIRYLKSRLAACAASIEWITFFKYRERRPAPAWELRFAVCNTLPRYEARQLLYRDAARIVDATGWYPLVMGRRIRQRRPLPMPQIRRLGTLRRMMNSIRLGEIIEIRAGAPDSSGSSILLQFDHNVVLLDFGFRCDLSAGPVPRVAFLTHSHEDHSGGIKGAMAARIPILLNESIYRQLLDNGRLPDSGRENCFPVTAPCRFFSQDGAEIRLIPGAHSPGTTMVLITTLGINQILYPGDYCLTNAYYQRSPGDLMRYFSKSARSRTLLIDGTFLGYELKHECASLDELEVALTSILKSGRSAIFLSKGIENLYPLYLWVFRKFYSSGGGHDRSLVLDPKLQLLLDSTFGDMFFRHRQPDPYISAILKKAETNYVESARIYHLANGRIPRSLPHPVDVFCSTEQAQRVLLDLSGDAVFFVIGRRSNHVERLLAGPLANKDIRLLDGVDFTFHSRPGDVARIVSCAAANGVRPILFHNYPNIIRSALDELGVPRESYGILQGAAQETDDKTR
jgi:glyoxylase-like metal-dependent hydrolase (beta-lactamase superfamily II)